MICETAKIYPGVRLGKNVVIEDFCIIGVPPREMAEGELETIIGDNAIIRSHTIIYAGNVIGDHFETGHKANIREFNKIGDHVSIGTLSVIEHHVIIGNNVRIHTCVFICEYSTLKERAWVGPQVVFTNAKFPNTEETKKELKGPVVGESAKIGAHSTLLPGVVIGRHSLVGAGSVVTKDIPENLVAIGNPAKMLRKI